MGPTTHRITNHDVPVDGATARATSYLDALLWVEHEGFDLLHVVGACPDGLRRADGRWRITDRVANTFLWRREHC